MTTQDQLRNIVGSTAYDRSGDKIGKVGAVYYDDQTDEPKWVTVHTGLFGTNETFVPFQGADLSGDRVTLAYEKAQVKDAPNISEDGHLSPQEEEQLYRYYGLGYDNSGYDESRTQGFAAGDVDGGRHATGRTDRDRDGVFDDVEGRTVGRDTSGPTTDEAMTRSEENLRVGTETVQTGRARLRKHVVTEQQQVTVPVTREEVTLEREPITETNRGEAYDGPAISEEEHEVTLHAERPVVDVEAVAVERVRLGKDTVTEQETVGGEVRKEEIELDKGDTVRDGRRDDVRTDRR
jgi:uncharacterized protein (TIGR02271 family)